MPDDKGLQSNLQGPKMENCGQKDLPAPVFGQVDILWRMCYSEIFL